MSTILLNEFLTRFVTGLVAWLAFLVIFSLLLKWRWRVLTDEVESEEKDQFHNKSDTIGASINGKFFKADLPIFIFLNLVWYISATWIFCVFASNLILPVYYNPIQSQCSSNSFQVGLS